MSVWEPDYCSPTNSIMGSWTLCNPDVMFDATVLREANLTILLSGTWLQLYWTSQTMKYLFLNKIIHHCSKSFFQTFLSLKFKMCQSPVVQMSEHLFNFPFSVSVWEWGYSHWGVRSVVQRLWLRPKKNSVVFCKCQDRMFGANPSEAFSLLGFGSNWILPTNCPTEPPHLQPITPKLSIALYFVFYKYVNLCLIAAKQYTLPLHSVLVSSATVNMLLF